MGAGLFDLPEFFRTGLYKLTRGGLADAEVSSAFVRCQAWFADAKKNGFFGRCECPCGVRLPVDAKNAQGTSVWHLDHDKHRKTFRGILFQRCNREIGDGDRERKWGHAEYIEANEARLPEETTMVQDRNEFQAAGAIPD